MVKYGVKTLYYQNSLTEEASELQSKEEPAADIAEVETKASVRDLDAMLEQAATQSISGGVGCESGVCTL